MAGSSIRCTPSGIVSFTASPTPPSCIATETRAAQPRRTANGRASIADSIGFSEKGSSPRTSRGGRDAVREVRNEGTHADYPALLMPMDAMRSLDILAREIDALFGS